MLLDTLFVLIVTMFVFFATLFVLFKTLFVLFATLFALFATLFALFGTMFVLFTILFKFNQRYKFLWFAVSPNTFDERLGFGEETDFPASLRHAGRRARTCGIDALA